jgi:hypothetical protein
MTAGAGGVAATPELPNAAQFVPLAEGHSAKPRRCPDRTKGKRKMFLDFARCQGYIGIKGCRTSWIVWLTRSTGTGGVRLHNDAARRAYSSTY